MNIFLQKVEKSETKSNYFVDKSRMPLELFLKSRGIFQDYNFEQLSIDVINITDSKEVL